MFIIVHDHRSDFPVSIRKDRIEQFRASYSGENAPTTIGLMSGQFVTVLETENEIREMLGLEPSSAKKRTAKDWYEQEIIKAKPRNLD